MHAGAHAWAGPFFYGMPNHAETLRAGRYLRVPLSPGSGKASKDLLGLLKDDTRGLDLLDYCLGLLSLSDEDEDYGDEEHEDEDYQDENYDWVEFRVAELQNVLDASGSAWTVGRDEDERYCLQRRLDATTEQTAREEMGQPGRAAGYLRRAWSNVYGRTPDPSVAYGAAVRAVEAAARLVITPTDEVATLGKMVAAMRDKPEKWETVIGDVNTV